MRLETLFISNLLLSQYFGYSQTRFGPYKAIISGTQLLTVTKHHTNYIISI
jgi:hypothetical protein